MKRNKFTTPITTTLVGSSKLKNVPSRHLRIPFRFFHKRKREDLLKMETTRMVAL